MPRKKKLTDVFELYMHELCGNVPPGRFKNSIAGRISSCSEGFLESWLNSMFRFFHFLSVLNMRRAENHRGVNYNVKM